jgi:MFS family permease
MVPILVWKGQSEITAPLLVGLLSFTAVPLRFVMGYISDSWSRQKTAAIGMAMGSLGVVMLLLTGGAFWQLVVFVMLLAFAESVSAVSWALIGDFYGRRNFATLRGVVTTVHSFMSMGTPVFAGWVFDRTQSYELALWPILAVYIAAGIVFWTLPKPRTPERLQQIDTEPQAESA